MGTNCSCIKQNKHELIKKHTELSDVDLSVFTDEDEDELNINCLKENSCIRIRRITSGLKYYTSLNIDNDKKHQNMFTEFVDDIYPKLLDDFIHLNNHHSNQLHEIYQELKTCDIIRCQYTSRHHENDHEIDHEEKEFQVSDSKFDFYKQTMDGLHFYLLHCYDAGLRARHPDDIERKYEFENDEEIKHDQYFDAAFSSMNKYVTDTEHITSTFERFSAGNSKFRIQVDNEETDNTTAVDEMHSHLQRMNVAPDCINKFKEFIQCEEYDTDCIQDEFANENDIESGNITKLIENDPFARHIYDFIQAMKISSSSFSIGFRFYYWRYYETMSETPDNEQYTENINNHSGYNISDLFIKARYGSFKEEISNYNPRYITKQQYEERVVVKVNEYQKSAIAKATQADNIYVPEQYEIEYKSPLHFDHILSLVLYTDYTNLSTDFSSTFRKTRAFETLHSIKRRNRVYYWLSKRLRECVEIYGQCQWSVPAQSGPFYCGMSTAMHMPSFNIRLCSPTSTSMQLEVSIKFAGSHGIVIQVNNPKTAQYEYLRSFNVAWISRYKEEDERLLFGGYYFIKIESIRIRSTLQNFEPFIYVLYYLDTMITGGRQGSGDFDDIDMKINQKDILVVNELINDKLKREPTRGSFDQYIYSTFASFAQNKQQITLDLEELNSANAEIRDILMHSMAVRIYNKETDREKDDFSNLFRTDMLMVFKNVQNIVIKTTSDYGKRSYSISMEALLSLIKLRSVREIIVKAITREKRNWIYALWKSSAETLKQQYDINGYTISFKETQDYDEDQEYWFMVSKKN